MSWRIAIRHRTGYRYAGPVQASYNEARLTPPSLDGQRTLQAALAVTPAVRPLRYVDYWGTMVDAFDIHVPHTELVVLATSMVETARPRPLSAGTGWADLADAGVQDRFAELLAASTYVTAEPELAEVGRSLRAGSTPVQAGLRAAGPVLRRPRPGRHGRSSLRPRSSRPAASCSAWRRRWPIPWPRPPSAPSVPPTRSSTWSCGTGST